MKASEAILVQPQLLQKIGCFCNLLLRHCAVDIELMEGALHLSMK